MTINGDEERYRGLFEAMPSGVAVYAPVDDGADFVFRELNRAAERIDGVRRAELIGCRLTDVFPGVEAMGLLDALRRVTSSGEAEHIGPARYEDPHRHGWRENWVYRLPSGEVAAIYSDVTQRQELEEQLRHGQRLESIGRLAGGVAHDFNNLLAPIITIAQVMLEELPAHAGHRVDVQQIRDAADRAAALTRQLLALSRRQALDMATVDLNEVVRRFLRMMRRTVPEDIGLDSRLAPLPLRVKVDVAQLEQVLMNLVLNACDATPAGGTITMATHPPELSPPGMAESANARAGWFTCLTVQDTGPGIAEDVLPHVFEPFFTTKPPGEGTGLGLATAHGIINQHDGDLTVTSEVGRGALFRISLPLASRVGSSEPDEAMTTVDSGGDEQVLVVDDDVDLREAARRCLTQMGYRVLLADSGTKALELAADPDRVIDLVLTDVIMPGLSGHQLYRRLAALRPGIRVLYMTGHGDAVVASRGVAVQGAAFLLKPFSPESICRRVREALDG